MKTYTTLCKKLHPNQFSAMSGKMAAIIGCILGQNFTSPELTRLIVTNETVLGMQRGDIGYNDFIGSVHDLTANIDNLIEAAELTPEETKEFRGLMVLNIRKI